MPESIAVHIQTCTKWAETEGCLVCDAYSLGFRDGVSSVTDERVAAAKAAHPAGKGRVQ